MAERVVVFGKASRLVGIVHDPPAEVCVAEAPAVILLNAGMVHRVGPNRMYVKLARTLAAQGVLVLRFDFSGFGDSGVRQDHLPMAKSVIDETQEAMSFLSKQFGPKRFVLMGLCSGATASLKTAAIDERVVGAVLINARAGGEELQSYIKGRSAIRKYWNFVVQNRTRLFAAIREKMHVRGLLNVFRALGRDAKGKLGGSKKSFPEAEQTAADIQAITGRGARLLVLCSEWDPGLEFMKVVLGVDVIRAGGSEQLRFQIIGEADHTFTESAKQESVIETIRDWWPAAITAESKLCGVG